ncbi:MAG: bifunctional glutamate N-acetyltransferase/amino-acid acetyltransferase ArgJ [Bacteroidetes bacterium]|nr:bifunctional glutamate N-acetyltransferase/amino-acid acetyltransferase ArgJ [Bacteroidota bacterium]
MQRIQGGVTAPAGFLAGATYCGIKTRGPDLSLVFSERPCIGAGVFTTNKVKAAPVRLTEQHLGVAQPQAIIANSGNANACTGEYGHRSARETTALVAAKLGIAPEQVLVASTGVIGVPLPMDKIRAGIEALTISPDGGHQAALGIMTTDTHPKEAAVSLDLGAKVTLGAMAKGAGMIHPNMATLFCFVTTDAALEPEFARAALREAVGNSFNMISVDGDTSTSDTLLLLANGAAGNRPLAAGTPEAAAFQAALNALTIHTARAIARDGEGATKLIEARVEGAGTLQDARLAARAIVSSNLTKAAIYGNDPNWGRILCAVGYSGAEVDPDVVDVIVEGIPLMRAGLPLPFDKRAASDALRTEEVHILVDLHRGDASATAWGCDLTEEYVRFNAEYTT